MYTVLYCKVFAPFSIVTSTLSSNYFPTRFTSINGTLIENILCNLNQSLLQIHTNNSSYPFERLHQRRSYLPEEKHVQVE